MAIIVNGITIPRSSGNIISNGVSVNKVVCNGTIIWARNETTYIYTGSGNPFSSSLSFINDDGRGSQFPSVTANNGYIDFSLTVGTTGKAGTIWVPVSIEEREKLCIDCEWITYGASFNPSSGSDVFITNGPSGSINYSNIVFSKRLLTNGTSSIPRKMYTLDISNITGTNIVFQLDICNITAILRVYSVYII